MNDESNVKPCCCSAPKAPSCGCASHPKPVRKRVIDDRLVTGWIDTAVGKIPRVSTQLRPADKLGTLKIRLGIRRMTYNVDPGLYAVGHPGADSSVFVTSNYKLSFDSLRKQLGGLNAWILVLDTHGINVWCAAGKKKFSTDEVVRRLDESGLGEIVTHRQLILPQLGATGVAAHEVRRRSGFSVIYGPVRASDIPDFLAAGMKATPQMREVTFTMWERLKVVPVEVTQSGHILLAICLAFFLLSGLSRHGYAIDLSSGLDAVVNILLAYVAGTVLSPIFLPWLPGPSFSLKGAFAGALVFIISYLTGITETATLQGIAWLLLMISVSSFLAMNFTGSSTFTSLSGVRKEMRVAVPLQIAAVSIGLILWIWGLFIKS
ncbi:MAG: mercury methylation corrinoid protein HgcA [Candidatus Omnitrophota bacterium]